MSDPRCTTIGKVWGFSSNCPNLLPSIDVLSINADPRLNEYWPSGHKAFPGLSPADPAFPEVAAFVDGASYSVVAAKVPASFPYGCSTTPITSSNDGRLDESEKWSAALTTIVDVIDRGTEARQLHLNKCRAVISSRAVYVDGKQAKITYGITSILEGQDPINYDDELTLEFGNAASDGPHLDQIQIDIATQVATTYSTSFLGRDFTTIGAIGPMGDLYLSATLPSAGAVFNFFNDYAQPRPNCRYWGLDYYFFSQYSPELDICAGDGPNTFIVGRVHLADLEFVAGGSGGIASPSTGPYLIVLPSCRAFLQSAADSPDEPWVCAIKLEDNPDYPEGGGSKPYITTGLVTGRALNSDMRGDYWDGTLEEGEKENTIVPTGSGPYTGETWNDLRVRCYNHKDGEDLLLWTTKDAGADSTDATAAPTAIFGTDGGTGAEDLNAGISADGLAFSNPQDDHGNGWAADGRGYFTDPGTWVNNDNTKYACKASVGPVFLTQVDLTIDIDVVANDSVLSFDAMLQNCAQSDTFPFSRLGPFPASDGLGNHDTLEMFDNGVLVWSTYNADFTTFDEFFSFHTITSPTDFPNLNAGRHRLRWTLKRFTAANDMTAYLDNIVFPNLLVKDDFNAVKRWYYDGERVRRAKFWAWPKRDDEGGHTDISSRVSTVPDFIAKDKQGHVLYGNPHYVARIIVDGIDNDIYPDGKLDTTFADKGFLRFSASPAIDPPARYQDDNCEWVDLPNPPFDDIDDPKGFQILPFGDDGDFQLRGVNGAIRDATADPLNQELYPTEEFAYATNAPPWNSRASSWTITENGTVVVPHLEVLFRPTYDQPAYPVAPDTATYPTTDGYQTPPFPGSMQADCSVLEVNTEHAGDPLYATQANINWCRVRDPNKAFGDKPSGDPDTRKPVWSAINVIVPRTYGDTYSLRPQFVWAKPDHELSPDPVTGDDPGYLDYPYPSAKWLMITARHCPSADHIGYQLPGPTARHCVNLDVDDPDDWHYTWGLVSGFLGGMTDFDAVDEDCDCDCCDE